MTIVDDTRLATLARTLADLQRAHADFEMEFTKARVALGRHRHSTATLAEDIERVVALAGRPAGLASPAALEMAGAPPTRAGALHDAMAALGQGNQDQPAPVHPLTAIRAALVGAVRSDIDPALIHALADALRAVEGR